MTEFDPTLPRREFLRQLGLLAGGAAVLGGSAWSGNGIAADARNYIKPYFFLEMDGANLGSIKSFEGGFARGEVISLAAQPGTMAKKQIGPYRYEPIGMECDLPLAKPIYDWVSANLSGKFQRKNGAVITASYDFKEKSRLQFNQALISEIGFPALDASSKEPAYLALKLVPDMAAPLAGSDARINVDLGDRKNQIGLASNFRLSIAGLDCNRVNRVEPFTVKSVLRQDKTGNFRDTATHATGLEIPNLSFSLPEAEAGGFYAWFQDMVIKGNSGDNNERQGTLEFMSRDMKTPLLTVRFANLGIFGFTPDKSDSRADNPIKRIRIDLYCEQISLA